METAETTEQTQKSSFWSGSTFPLVFGISAGILHDYFSVFTAWILAGLLATFISYFVEFKPKVGFVKFFLVMQASLLVAAAGLALIPPRLREVMPEFWANALPALLLFNAAYFAPSLDGSRRGAWWKWILASFLFAAVYGWVISSLAWKD